MLRKTWLRTVGVLGVSAFVLAGVPGFLPAADDKAVKKEEEVRDFDVVFLKDAAERMAGEIELCQLVDTLSKTEGVKHYSHLQITSYRPMLDELRTLAQDRHIKVPTELSEHQKEVKGRLLKVKGDEFDMQFVSDQIDEQESLITLFDRGSRDLKEAKLRQFATARLPNLKERLAVAKDLYRDVKKDNK